MIGRTEPCGKEAEELESQFDPGVPDATSLNSIETVIVPVSRDIGGFEVRRALPAPGRRMVGPFVFFDRMGPAEFVTGQGIDVRPHPHIGLATVTYLYRGEIQHRDSLGSNQVIHPGAVNWMVAGKGITHSERTAQTCAARRTKCPASRPGSPCRRRTRTTSRASRPRRHNLPEIEDAGASLRLILGRLLVYIIWEIIVVGLITTGKI